MIARVCDRCGQPIEEGQLRYTAKIQVFAAYDPLNITFDELERDYASELRQVLEQCRGLSEAELMRDVYVEYQFDLCPACQKAYIRDPLAIDKRRDGD
jgi:hypothetical protein